MGQDAIDDQSISFSMNVMENEDKRRFKRTDFHAKGFITCSDVEYPVDVINVSLKGILLVPQKPINPEIGLSYPVRISLPHSSINIQTKAALIHYQNGEYGFHFDSIEADGMIHLRRFMELNISSDEQIAKELESLVD